MMTLYRIVVFLFITGLIGPVWSAQDNDNPLNAIVKVRAVIPETARTAAALGTEREGSGVVIDSEGLILTIGYLILETESIEVVLGSAAPVSAYFVAYDHETGFGDIILTVNSEPVSTLADCYRRIWAIGNAGVEVPLEVLKRVRVQSLKVRSADRHQYLHIQPIKSRQQKIYSF